MKDCVIVGGGPAGLTAALYLARFLRSVKVIDAEEGRAGMIPKTHNLAPFPDGISGRDLLERMRSHAAFYGAAIENGTVAAVEKLGNAFRIATDRHVESARTVVLASGVFNHRPPLSVEVHDRGLARGLIRYCPVCDAHEVRRKHIAVLGSGAHGFDEARFLRDYSSSVTLIPCDGSVAEKARLFIIGNVDPVRRLCCGKRERHRCSGGTDEWLGVVGLASCRNDGKWRDPAF